MDFSKTLFRCSSLGYIMTEPKGRSDKDACNLSETAKTHLIDIYVSKKYGRQSDVTSKYIQKGLMVEEDSITLFSRINKTFYKKNEQHLKNEFIQGTPDLFEGECIEKANRIIDVKSSWDIFTFFRNKAGKLQQNYFWQMQGYMALTGAKEATVAYCLIDTPDVFLNDEKRKLFWKMGVATEENELYLKACEKLEKLMTYGDIPIKERLIEFEVKRNDEEIERLYRRIGKCREFLNELDGVPQLEMA